MSSLVWVGSRGKSFHAVFGQQTVCGILFDPGHGGPMRGRLIGHADARQYRECVRCVGQIVRPSVKRTGRP